MQPGDVVALGGYEFRFEGAAVRGPNIERHRTAHPAPRRTRSRHPLPGAAFLSVQQMHTTQAAIRTNSLYDLYAVIGDTRNTGGGWSCGYLEPRFPGSVRLKLHGFGRPGVLERSASTGGRASSAPAVTQQSPPVTRPIMKRLLFILPLLIFAISAAFLYWGLNPGDPAIPWCSSTVSTSVRAPPIEPALRQASPQRICQRPDREHLCFLVPPCRAEHPLLVDRQNSGMFDSSASTQDKPEDALAWLGLEIPMRMGPMRTDNPASNGHLRRA